LQLGDIAVTIQPERLVMRVPREKQRNPVSDEVLALTAVVRPILAGVLYGLKADIAVEAGGYDNVKVKMLPRPRRAATAI
jgi:hypothetical protein